MHSKYWINFRTFSNISSFYFCILYKLHNSYFAFCNFCNFHIFVFLGDYIYIYIYIQMCIYVYIYIHRHIQVRKGAAVSMLRAERRLQGSQPSSTGWFGWLVRMTSSNDLFEWPVRMACSNDLFEWPIYVQYQGVWVGVGTPNYIKPT